MVLLSMHSYLDHSCDIFPSAFWAVFHAAVAIAKGRSLCFLNGRGILDQKLKIGGPVSKLEVQIWHWENGFVLKNFPVIVIIILFYKTIFL